VFSAGLDQELVEMLMSDKKPSKERE